MGTTPTPPAWRRKVRYHHGDLRASALARGREIVTAHGPAALTLRGLARDLGVTAPALVYFFGSVAELRAAVAASVLEQAASACGDAWAPDGSRRTAKEVGSAWITFAAENANLYRLACGEGWHAQPAQPRGYLGGARPMESPRRSIETLLLRETRRFGNPGGDRDRAQRLSCSIHGLALARLDGVPEEAVATALERTLAA